MMVSWSQLAILHKIALPQSSSCMYIFNYIKLHTHIGAVSLLEAASFSLPDVTLLSTNLLSTTR